MVRAQEAQQVSERLTYVDTHIALELSRAGHRALSREQLRALNRNVDVRISPMVMVELEDLYEIGRAKYRAKEIVDKLAAELGVRVCDRPFAEVAMQAAHESWTRDVFDRMIVAQARIAKAPLITRDEHIRAHYSRTIG